MKTFNVEDYKVQRAAINKRYLGKMRSVQVWMNPAKEDEARALEHLDKQPNKRQYLTDLILRDIEQTK